MKQYTSLWLVCLLAVFSMTARAQEGIETKARPDYPALPFMLTFEAPAEGSASLSISADGETLTSPTTLHSGTEVTITVTPADGYRMASGYPKVYRTGTPSETVTVTPAATDNAYTFTMPAFPATAEVKYEKIQSAVTFTDPAHGSLALDAVTASGTIGLFSGKELAPGIAVKILATPADGYRMASGYPKVYRTGAPDETVPATFKPDASSGIAYLYTFTMPDFPVTVEVEYEKIQSTVTFANPANGTLTLSTADAPGSSIVSGGEVASGTKVTIAATPNKGYQMVFGSLKVSGKVGNETKTVPLQKEKDGTTYFLMPAYAVTAEVKFEPIPVVPSSEARLSSLSYKVGNEAATPLPGFLASTMKYEVLLPSSTLALTLSGQLADAKAKLLVNGSPASVQPAESFTATVSLVDGSAKATLVVTAEDGQTKRTYEVNFTVPNEAVYYVTILQPEGGTISVSYKTEEGKEVSVKSGDAVYNDTKLSLTHTALPNYDFEGYKVNGDPASETITVSGSDLKITAAFKLQSSVTPEEIASIGTPAVPKEAEEQGGTILPTDAPIVIIPDAVSLPSDTELSSLRLVKEDIEDPAKKAEIEEKAKAAAQDAGIAPDAPKIVMEVTLVKVTTTISATDASTTTAVTPVQPSDIVTVRIPYPEGVNKTQHDIVIIHLRSDGVVDVYSEGNNNLTLEDDYMEISVASFSPFVVSYTPKSGPVDPDYPDTPDTPDTPTSNASVEGGIAVWTSANALHIRADRPAEAWVVGLSGASRARFAVVPGETRRALPAGVYLVRIADQTYKVRIRN
ncbi:cadherin-like beta sandwich domain-containing protein [Parabacteroides distasonis]|uniref:InlB B-repeat-containing protein n=1 Tax=Parabacteroides distasonis TaxID=823 RepID=UPI001C3844C3|nr:cadherin-like beta sandwich domain-containing protein [Parabacteroides distasonis]MBV4226970.1 cadherin-like beta sandwich domain-containing protein [Parabacteroides distasonis]